MLHALTPSFPTRRSADLDVGSRRRNGSYRKLFKQMYGDRPAWSPGLNGLDRERAIINIFTRMRYCTPRGRIAFEDKNAPGTQQPGLYPWYAVPGRPEPHLKICYGHWSEPGLSNGHCCHAHHPTA